MKRPHRRWARVLWALVAGGALATFAAAVLLHPPAAPGWEAR